MLCGRDRELLAVARLLEDARVGRSGVLGRRRRSRDRQDSPARATPRSRRSGMKRAAGPGRAIRGPDPVRRPARAAAPGARLPRPRFPARRPRRSRARSRCGPARAQDRFAVGAATLSLLAAYADDSSGRGARRRRALARRVQRGRPAFRRPAAGRRSGRRRSSPCARASRPCSTGPAWRPCGSTGLDLPATAELLSGQLGPPVRRDLADRLHRRDRRQPARPHRTRQRPRVAR